MPNTYTCDKLQTNYVRLNANASTHHNAPISKKTIIVYTEQPHTYTHKHTTVSAALTNRNDIHFKIEWVRTPKSTKKFILYFWL